MGKKTKKETQECLNNICIRFPTYENECYDKRTRILRTMLVTMTFDPVNTNQSTIVLLFVEVRDLASMEYFVFVAK